MAGVSVQPARGRSYNAYAVAFLGIAIVALAVWLASFFHLMPLPAYKNKVYFTLGMGSGHYIFLSGNCLLWYQTDQSFGDKLPPKLLKFYPV